MTDNVSAHCSVARSRGGLRAGARLLLCLVLFIPAVPEGHDRYGHRVSPSPLHAIGTARSHGTRPRAIPTQASHRVVRVRAILPRPPVADPPNGTAPDVREQVGIAPVHLGQTRGLVARAQVTTPLRC